MASRPDAAPPLTARSGRVRAARRLARRASRAEHRRFLAEGPQAVREALARDGCVTEVFAASEVAAQHPDLHAAAEAQQVPWLLVDRPAMQALAETVHPQGVVAVCRFLDEPLDRVVPERPARPGAADSALVAVCADVRDPGNAGTVIRCADAAGAAAVVLAGTSVDPYNGKCVRASAGSLFHVPLATAVPVGEAVDALRRRGFQVLAADGAGEIDLDEAESAGILAAPTAWLFGNEAWGLPGEVASLADRRVRIPIHGRAESLNLATAAAVCLYASARVQRRAGRATGSGAQHAASH